MNKKEILTIILLICVIFSLQAVVAADSGSNSIDGNVLSVDNDVSSYALPSSENNSLAVANEAHFTDLQTVVTNGGADFASHNYTWDTGENEVTISDSIELDGDGKVIIDAKGQSRIFNIASGATVTLKGITFINGYVDGNGGSIYSEGTLTIENCNFTDNTAEHSGGAIYSSGNYLNITDSIFDGNQAIHDTTVTDGTSGDGGAILVIGDHTTIKNSNFTNNYAKNRGGAIFIHSNSEHNSTNSTIDNCRFEFNTAGLNGGGVDWQYGAHDTILTNSIFTNNTAGRSGGAAYLRVTNSTIRNCNFTNNSAYGNDPYEYNSGIIIVTDTNGGNGGALVWRGVTGIIDNCNFTTNNAKRLGGAIHTKNNNNLNITNCHFDGNNATNGGAIHFNTGSANCKIDSCTFDDNEAKRSAGAVFWIGNYGKLYNSNFTNNTAHGGVSGAVAHNGTNTTGGSGGAIIWAGANGTITHCNFYDNNATKRGGAVFLESTKEALCSNVTFDDCRFENNTAGTNGGALAWDEGVMNGTMLNSVFINNTAKRNGGAIYWNGINGTVKNSIFENNRAIGKWEYDYPINMGTTIVKDGDKLILGNITVVKNAAIFNNALHQVM